jgi:hypothetical protein
MLRLVGFTKVKLKKQIGLCMVRIKKKGLFWTLHTKQNFSSPNELGSWRWMGLLFTLFCMTQV